MRDLIVYVPPGSFAEERQGLKLSLLTDLEDTAEMKAAVVSRTTRSSSRAARDFRALTMTHRSVQDPTHSPKNREKLLFGDE
jgi:hypothetical protein